MKALSCFIIFFACCGSVPLSLCAEEPNHQAGAVRIMTLPQALQRVLDSNPELTASGLDIQAASARIRQAGFRPNPEISAQVQNLPALNPGALLQTTEADILITQKLETARKRDLRVQAAGKERDVAARALERARADWMFRARIAFIDVLVNQQRLTNGRELTRLARASHALVVDRIAVGKASPVEQVRSNISLAAIQLEEEKQVRELVASKDRLASLWGGSASDFDQVQETFDIPPARPDTAACLPQSPDLQLAAAAVESRRAVLNLEQALRKPDLTLTGGYRRSNTDSYNAWVAGISIPLPLFDKRQGSIAEAQRLLEKTLLEKKAAERNLRADLAQARHVYDIAVFESATITQAALPAAAEVLASAEEGYRLGKFDYLNVLEAQRTHAELTRKYIDAVASGMKAVVEIDRLAGCNLQGTSPKELFHEK